MTNHLPGTFCWPELATTDQAAAKKFYTALFGWGINDQPTGPDAVYSMFTVGGREVAAARSMDPQQKSMGIPPHWFSYISAKNADETLAKARALGGKVAMDAFDVMDAGRMGIVFDPTGAAFGVWQANKNIGAHLLDRPGTLVWTEQMSTDAEASRNFYSKLFDWGVQLHEMGPMTYTVFLRGEMPAGGLMQITPDMGRMPSNWLPYFGSDNVDATTAKAVELGGTAIMPPADIPNVGRFSVIQDPQGATFGLLKFLPRS